MERKKVFTAVVGSVVYNTNDKNSDMDRKCYEFPTFDDLYKNKDWSKSYKTEEGDIEKHDIRKLPDMLFKSNINFMELLFSPYVDVGHVLYNELREIREDIARMNLPYLFAACQGMYARKGNDVRKQMILLDMPGADVRMITKKIWKSIATMYRISDMLIRYKENGFESFLKAIRYEDSEAARKTILLFREGNIDTSLMLEATEKHNERSFEYQDDYRKQEVNERLNLKVREIIQNAVEQQIMFDLREDYGL